MKIHGRPGILTARAVSFRPSVRPSVAVDGARRLRLLPRHVVFFFFFFYFLSGHREINRGYNSRARRRSLARGPLSDITLRLVTLNLRFTFAKVRLTGGRNESKKTRKQKTENGEEEGGKEGGIGPLSLPCDFLPSFQRYRRLSINRCPTTRLIVRASFFFFFFFYDNSQLSPGRCRAAGSRGRVDSSSGSGLPRFETAVISFPFERVRVRARRVSEARPRRAPCLLTSSLRRSLFLISVDAAARHRDVATSSICRNKRRPNASLWSELKNSRNRIGERGD